MKNITVIGIGKLGLCFALSLEKNGFKVVGVDINEDYIRSLNEKTFVSDEPGVNTLILNSKNISITNDLRKGLEHSEIIFLFVATPSLPDGRYDHSQIERVSSQLRSLGNKRNKKSLVIGCTTMPGFCDILEKDLSRYGYYISYNPEFIAQGSIIKDLVKPDMVLLTLVLSILG